MPDNERTIQINQNLTIKLTEEDGVTKATLALPKSKTTSIVLTDVIETHESDKQTAISCAESLRTIAQAAIDDLTDVAQALTKYINRCVLPDDGLIQNLSDESLEKVYQLTELLRDLLTTDKVQHRPMFLMPHNADAFMLEKAPFTQEEIDAIYKLHPNAAKPVIPNKTGGQ